MAFKLYRCDMILITGGAGFIGGHLIEALKIRHIPFKALVHRHKVKGLLPNECIYGDLLHEESIDVKDFDTIFHIAGGYNTELNIVGTSHILKACINSTVKRFIFLSSLDVYVSPQTAYAASKRQAEALVKSSGLRYCIVRPSMVYGQGDHNISTLIGWIKRYPIVPVPGNVNVLRRPLYVDDLTSILISMCGKENIPAYVNVAGKDVISVGEMLNIIQQSLAIKRISLHIPDIFLRVAGLLSRRMRDIEENMIDKDYIKTDEDVLFGQTDFRTGIRKMLELFE